MQRGFRIKQRTIADCGPTCLAAVAAWHGCHIPISRARDYCSTDREGTNLAGIIEGAERIGFSSDALKSTVEGLLEIDHPSIAHTVRDGLFHFVVILKASPKMIKVMDPAEGKVRSMRLQEFLKTWTGVVIQLRPIGLVRSAHISTNRKLIQNLSPFGLALFLLLVIAIVYTISGFATAFYVRELIDKVITTKSEKMLTRISGIVLMIFGVQVLMAVAKNYIALRIGLSIDRQLFAEYFRNLFSIPLRVFRSFSTGELIQRFTDTINIRVFLTQTGISLLINLMIVLLSVAAMAVMNWQLSLIMIAALPVYWIIYIVTNSLNKRYIRPLMQNAAKFENFLVESIHLVPTIRALGVTEQISQSAGAVHQRLIDSLRATGLVQIYSSSLTDGISKIFVILLLWTGTTMVLEQHLTLGELMSFYALAAYFTGPVLGLVGLNKEYQAARIATDRLGDIAGDNEVQIRNTIHRSISRPGVYFSEVNFRYGSGLPVLQNFNAQIPGGLTTVITGPSGSGKSTLGILMEGGYTPQQGSIYIAGIELKTISNLSQFVHRVPQKVDIFKGSVIYNIAPGIKDPDVERINELISTLGLNPLVKKLPSGLHTMLDFDGRSLSGGEVQRIGIARALYADPELLILDEPTSELDSESSRLVLEAISKLQERERTVVVITHQLKYFKNADYRIKIDS